MNIVVYTALFGDKDVLWSVPPTATSGARYIVFTEKKRREVGLWTSGGAYGRPCSVLPGTAATSAVRPLWEQRIVEMPHGARRTARYYKTMVHEILDADVTVWVDANIRLLIKPAIAIKWLGKGNLAAFKHPDRRCLYQEVRACIEFGKSDKAMLRRQAAVYRAAGMPASWGLASTRCVVRQNTADQRALNEAWWKQIREYSERDQVSLPFVCWKQGRKWATIPGYATRSKSFWFILHGRLP